MNNINQTQKKTVSELELTLNLVKKLLQQKIDSGAKGLVLSKEDNIKMTYKKAMSVVESIEKCFSYKGAESYGICKTCKKFNTTKFQDKEFGYCGSEMRHKYDTCQNHSKSGGGFGV